MNTTIAAQETTYPPRRPVRRKRRPLPWVSLRTSDQTIRFAMSVLRQPWCLRHIQPLACAHPLRFRDCAETPSTISLKQASTIAEMRIRLTNAWSAVGIG